MRRVLSLLLSVVLLVLSCHAIGVIANTEKVIFVAPPAPLEPLFSSKALETLSPSKPALRKIKVQLSFETPTEEFFALEALDIGRKYEVRVCWPASVCRPLPAVTFGSPKRVILHPGFTRWECFCSFKGLDLSCLAIRIGCELMCCRLRRNSIWLLSLRIALFHQEGE